MKITLKKWIKNEEEKLRNFNDLKDEDDDSDLLDEDEDEDADDDSNYSMLIRMPKEKFAERLLNIEHSMAEQCINKFEHAFDLGISSLLEDAHSTVIHYLINGVRFQFARESERWLIAEKCRWLDSRWDNKYIDVETDDMNLITFERAFEKLDKPSVFEATRKMTKGELALFDSYVEWQTFQSVIEAFQKSIMVVCELFPEEEKITINGILAVLKKWANRFVKVDVKCWLNWYDEPWDE